MQLIMAWLDNFMESLYITGNNFNFLNSQWGKTSLSMLLQMLQVLKRKQRGMV